jgi:hypothetical protein
MELCPINVNCLPNDYNDEAYRIHIFAKEISKAVSFLPTVLSKIISEYLILLNINFKTNFKTVIQILFTQQLGMGSLRFNHLAGNTIVFASHPLSCLVPFWTIETQDNQIWSAGIRHPQTGTSFEIFSLCPQFDCKQKLTNLYYGKDVDSKNAQIHNFKIQKFDVANSLLKFKIDIHGSRIFVGSVKGDSDSDNEDNEDNNKNDDQDGSDKKEGDLICSCSPVLVWSNIKENLSEFIPFFRFSRISSSTGFRVVR